jgi:hypothetical protein
MRIEWGAIKVWKDIIPVTKQSLGTVDYPFRNIWGDMIYANLLAQAPQVVTNSLSLGKLSSDPGLLEGLLWYRSDLKRLRYYDGVFSRSLVHTDEFNSHASRHADGGADPITSPLPLSAIPPVLQPYRSFTASTSVDYVDFTDLDIRSHKCYLIIFTIKNSTGTASGYNIYVNGDYNANNYYREELSANGSSVTANRTTGPRISYATAGDRSATLCWIWLDPDGVFRCLAEATKYTGASMDISFSGVTRPATASNITSIRIAADVSGAIGTGSQFMLFRMGG